MPTEANLIHEFDHVMVDQQTAAKNINIYGLIRSIPLWDERYLDYDVQGGFWIRQGEGFLKEDNSWEHKPFDKDTTSGAAKIEHAADMFLNWVYDNTGNPNFGFTNNPAGDARRAEMDWILKSIFGE